MPHYPGVPADKRKLPPPFYPPTAAFMQETTLLNRLVHVTRVGLEMLHVTVDAAESSAGAALTEQQLQAALTAATPGLSVLQRVEMRPWVADRDLDDNVDDLGHIVLIFAIARYETWIDEILELHASEIAGDVIQRFPTASQAKAEKESQELRRALAAALQFPPRPGRPVQSAADAVQLLQRGSSRLASELGRIAQSSSRVMSDGQMENALRLFRMYKEIRNGLVHGGAVASDRAEQACVDAAVVTSATDANLNYLWPLPILLQGQPIPRVGLGDAIAFDAMVFQLVISLEARLIASPAGSRQLQARTNLKTTLAAVFDVEGERAGARVSGFITKSLNMKGVRSLPSVPTESQLRHLLQGACSEFALARTNAAIERSATAAAGWIGQRVA